MWSALFAAGLAVLLLAACGSSSSSDQATNLLKDTFTGRHTVTSGNLQVSLTVNASSSSSLKGPVTLSFGGPFQSLGPGKLPKSDFTISVSALGKNGSLALISTGTAGYVTLSGSSYQLPGSTFQQLQSGFSSVTPGSSSLSKLGIHPLDWLTKPTVAGNETVAGAGTTHIRAGVDVRTFLDDLNTFLGKAPSLGVSGVKVPSRISPATRDRIASEVREPKVDVWTGTSDKTLRKLAITLRLPVSGQLSGLLGSSTQLSLTMQYADLNQPQTIAAPSSLAPYSQLQAKLQSLLGTLLSAAGSGSGSASPGSSSGGSSSSPSANALNSYSQCLQKAGNDLSKAQQCAALLNGQ